MTTAPIPQRNATLPYRQVSVEVVVPVYNEQEALPESIPALCAYLETYFPYRWSVLIADNASTDATLSVAEGLASRCPNVSVMRLEEKGRGRALKAAWLASEADVVAYMDVDLSTNLWSFLPLVAPLASGHSDVAIGSRLLRGAHVTRQWKREVISRCYNLLIKLLFGNGFSDAQCGFKAIKRGVARKLLVPAPLPRISAGLRRAGRSSKRRLSQRSVLSPLAVLLIGPGWIFLEGGQV